MPMWVSDKRLYLDADGNVVEATDPTKATLLVAEGGKLTEDQARQYGLLGDEDAKGKAPTDNKAKVAPANKATAKE